MPIRIRLVGCKRYSFKGEIFDTGFVYELDEAKAKLLLQKNDDKARPYFARVESLPEEEEVIIEETTSTEVEGVKIARKRGRPRKHPILKTSGDTSTLEDEDKVIRRVSPPEAGAEEGIAV